MLFLLDANLPPGLARAIEAAGHECRHVAVLLRPDATDREVAGAANELGAVLVTKDADFAELKARGQLEGAVLWLRYGNMSNRQAAERLLPALPQVVAAIAAGEDIVEVR